MNLVNPVSPALPVAPSEYSRVYHDTLNNMTRLFYKQLSNVNTALLSVAGGAYLKQPYGSTYSTATQTITASTAAAVTFNTTRYVNQIPLSSTTTFTPVMSGLYKFHFSAQCSKTAGAAANVWFWFNVNSTDIAYSAVKAQLEGVTALDALVSGTIILSVVSGDAIKFMWASDSSAVSLVPVTASAYTPATPSVRLDISFVSAPPS